MSSIRIAGAIILLAGCALGAEERRGANDTTEAQLPASPELYTEAEFEQAAAEITRYEDAEKKSATTPAEKSAKLQ